MLQSMTSVEDIAQMPLHEKLLFMEAIWDDISKVNDSVAVPQWHKDILDQREKAVENGQARFIDWEEAKAQIQRATS